jgi:hypothetical protein
MDGPGKTPATAAVLSQTGQYPIPSRFVIENRSVTLGCSVWADLTAISEQSRLRRWRSVKCAAKGRNLGM